MENGKWTRQGTTALQLIICSTDKSFTIGNGLHGDSSSILPVALLIELDDRATSVLLRRMKRVQAALMSAELLHGSGAERVAGRNQHSETVLDQPERDLERDKRDVWFTGTCVGHNKKGLQQ